jgi:hypothetical protein
MSHLRSTLRRSTLPLLLVACLAALSFSYAFANEATRPLAVTVIGDPDAAVAGKFAVGSSSVGSKALTVTGVIDFLGAGTVHNYFTQGGGNNMQINTNVDEANAVGDASKSQWKLVLGSSLDQFSIRRSPASGTYNEDALFFIDGSTGNVAIATVDTGNGASIPFTPSAKLDVETGSGIAVRGASLAVSGQGVYGYASATAGTNYGVMGRSDSASGLGVYGLAVATTGNTFGIYGESDSTNGRGVYGYAPASTGNNYGVLGRTSSTDGYGVLGEATPTSGMNYGVYGRNSSTAGTAVLGWAIASTGTNYGVLGRTSSTDGYGVYYIGSLGGTGTKSAIVDTQDYGWRALYAMESPQNWFEDFGQATLTAGQVVVSIEPIFAQTVNLKKPYHVFLTPMGDCSLYVSDRSGTAFTVRAHEGASCEISFDYRIIAPRLGYEDLRLKPAADPKAVTASMAPSEPQAPSP